MKLDYQEQRRSRVISAILADPQATDINPSPEHRARMKQFRQDEVNAMNACRAVVALIATAQARDGDFAGKTGENPREL